MGGIGGEWRFDRWMGEWRRVRIFNPIFFCEYSIRISDLAELERLSSAELPPKKVNITKNKLSWSEN